MDWASNRARYDSIARNVLKSYDYNIVCGVPGAIPIEKIAQHIGLNIEYQCIRKNGVVLGELVYDDTLVPVYFNDSKRYDLISVKAGTIILDASLLRKGSEGRLRFTCAHGIAHWILHKSVFKGTGRAAAFGNPNKSSQESPYIERQADMLGTALLMPTGQVKKAFHGNRYAPNPIAELAQIFEVSNQAMGFFFERPFITLIVFFYPCVPIHENTQVK
jgi:hypothetical protein